jgi:hypothetical protein
MVEAVLIAFVIGLFGGLVFLAQEYRRLRKNYLSLKEEVERHRKDIAGLCSAAISVDNQLSKHNQQLREAGENFIRSGRSQANSEKISYHDAIQSVRGGGGVDELMQQYYLNREEADLLIRLHGKV